MSDSALARLATLLNQSVADVRKLDIMDAIDEAAHRLGTTNPRRRKVRRLPEGMGFLKEPASWQGNGRVMVKA